MSQQYNLWSHSPQSSCQQNQDLSQTVADHMIYILLIEHVHAMVPCWWQRGPWTNTLNKNMQTDKIQTNTTVYNQINYTQYTPCNNVELSRETENCLR